MGSQHGFPHEASTAQHALVRLLVRMYELVSIPIVPRVECFAADVALERLLPCVYPEVFLVMLRVHEASVALITFVRSLPCVNAHHMVHKESLPFESLVTLITLVPFFLVMGCSLMRLKIAPLTKSGTTNFALEWFFTGVSPLMVLHFTFSSKQFVAYRTRKIFHSRMGDGMQI